MLLIDEKNVPLFYVEKRAEIGIFKIAEKVANDFSLVFGKRPELVSEIKGKNKKKNIIVFATVGNSELIDEYKIDVSEIAGKREVYGIFLRDGALIVCGSDKRGTIYGMFHLSELIGVSPLVYWGDAVPEKKKSFQIKKSMEMISNEPSVEYRGFFINDEWPCFGNWTFEHFGGFTAKMYDHVFELLLRLKGNYMWPAMWSSSFALDGPDEESARLADMYGVIIGNSHHEPCLRAGEEWDIYKGEDTIYKTQWNYLINKEGLLNFWRDGLKRSAKYESIITVGMRGERDSILQGPNSLKENIDVLKDIITEQKKLIDKYGRRNGKLSPCMLAIYKEVERYYYGDEQTEGLSEWEGLEDLILLFCEDNFGHMRYLPDKAHNGGYGMYYHLDYHGDPISYEWINSTPLSAIWEQMTIAYEHDVRKLWIVNVGDLKGNEFPLSYFMDMAYDFEKWGTKNVNSPREYTNKWIDTQFGGLLDKKEKEELAEVITESVLVIGKRRPEALDNHTYSLKGEADELLVRVKALEKRLGKIEKKLNADAKKGFYSMVADSLRMGLNLIKMQIYSSYNEHYARQGKVIANKYAKKVRKCLDKDFDLIEIAGEREQCKWRGMWNTSHIGFRKWNEDGCRNPIIMKVEPFSRPRMIVSVKGEEKVYQKNYGTPECVDIWDFTTNPAAKVCIEIANDGVGEFDFQILELENSWLSYEVSNYRVSDQEYIVISAKDDVESQNPAKLRIVADDVMVDVLVHPANYDNFSVKRNCIAELMASEYRSLAGDTIVLRDFGRYDSAVKLNKIGRTKVSGYVEYEIAVPYSGEYDLLFHMAPSNKLSKLYNPEFEVVINEAEALSVNLLPDDYSAGEAGDACWAKGVIDQEHKVEISVKFEQGTNLLRVIFKDEICVLEKIDVFNRI